MAQGGDIDGIAASHFQDRFTRLESEPVAIDEDDRIGWVGHKSFGVKSGLG
jgi:hypothetical protein